MNGLPAHQIDVYRIRLDLPPDRVEACAATLHTDEQARAMRLLSAEKQREFIITRASLRRILSERLGEPPARIYITHQARGKPCLEANGDEHRRRLRFSVSHSHDLALIAVGIDIELGVDLEKIRNDIDHLTLARRFFSGSEYTALAAIADPAMQRRAFFAVWTRKEAVVKAHGGGIALGLKNFEVTVDPLRPPRVEAARWPDKDVPDWTLIDIDAGSGYAACLACGNSGARLNLHNL